MALKVLSDFEHAAVEKVRVDEARRRIEFAAPLGDSPRGMWFHFKVAGGDGSPVTFTLTNREQMLGAGDYKRAVPVYRQGDGAWHRVRQADCHGELAGPLSANGDAPSTERRQFLFRVPCGPGVTEIAYCFPYTMSMLEAALDRWQGRRDVEVATICRSEGGRPVRVVRVGRPARGRKPAWVLARQHAGEVPGSYAAEGLIDGALGRSAWAQRLRRRVVLYVCLATDVDGVAEGMYGKDRHPVDFNRDWCVAPRRREIVALRKAMDASRRACGGPGGTALVQLDLHAPGPGTVSFPVPPHPAWAGRQSWQNAWWLARLIERFCPDTAPIRWANACADHIDWYSPAMGIRNTSTFHAAGGLADYSMTVELAYHWQANNRLVGPAEWRRMGLAMGRAIEALARGVRPPARVRPPDPPYELSPCWAWLNTPRQCNAKVHDRRVSVQADGPQAYAALLFREPIRIGSASPAIACDVYRNSRGKCPIHKLVFFFKRGVFTGEVTEQPGGLGSQPQLLWRLPARPKRPADSVRVAVVLRNWTGTVTLGRPERI